LNPIEENERFLIVVTAITSEIIEEVLSMRKSMVYFLTPVSLK
jgi:hypothetical protein